MVHPDKCKHPRAKDAFEVIGAAQKQLMDEEARAKLAFMLSHAKGATVVVVGGGGWVGDAVQLCAAPATEHVIVQWRRSKPGIRAPLPLAVAAMLPIHQLPFLACPARVQRR